MTFAIIFHVIFQKTNLNEMDIDVDKIRDLFKVKLYTIKSETKKERERERRKKREIQRQTYVNPITDSDSDPN